MVDNRFKYFESLADVQMLAMLSCIFAEPASQDRVGDTLTDSAVSKTYLGDILLNDKEQEKPLPMQVPAFSLRYFPSVNIARSIYQSTITTSSTPKTLHTPVDAYGSLGSSDGHIASYSVTPYSTGTTPPTSNRPAGTATEPQRPQSQSLSTSPERRLGRRSNASLASAFAATITRGISNTISSSPPSNLSKKRSSTTSSVPSTLAASTVTWGPNTFFAPAIEQPRNSSIADSEPEAPTEQPASGRVKIKVTLKSQSKFDCEGQADIPLLRPERLARCIGYRTSYANLLALWSLKLPRLEILKFNGLHYDSGELSSEQSLMGLGKKQAETGSSSAWTGLDIGSPRKRCIDLLRHKDNISENNHNICSSARKMMSCATCNEPIQSVFAPCLSCGHASHSQCHQRWFENSDRECPLGCGCRCLSAALQPPRIEIDDGAVDDLIGEKTIEPVVDGENGVKGWQGWEEIGKGTWKRVGGKA